MMATTEELAVALENEADWCILGYVEEATLRRQAAAHLRQLERELAAARAETAVMHRRAQKAEGEAVRVRNAYALPACCADAARARDAAEADRDASDTTRREWEVRAAESYAVGRESGLRDAAECCVDVVRLDFPTGGTVENMVAMVVKRCVDRIHALTGPSGRCPEKWGGAGSQCKHNAGHDGRHSWESEPHKVSGPSTDEEVEASDNLVIKENARKAKPNG